MLTVKRVNKDHLNKQRPPETIHYISLFDIVKYTSERRPLLGCTKDSFAKFASFLYMIRIFSYKENFLKCHCTCLRLFHLYYFSRINRVFKSNFTAVSCVAKHGQFSELAQLPHPSQTWGIQLILWADNSLHSNDTG